MGDMALGVDAAALELVVEPQERLLETDTKLKRPETSLFVAALMIGSCRPFANCCS
jgi:hypothetical protein